VPFGDVTAGAQREEDAPLVTVRPDLEARMSELARAATSLVPLVILGESGTGKELLARAVHRLSRRPGPLVAVNCGAIAATLVESELFGHVKGAFSGALADHPGLVRASDGGTLFLDEVGELSPAAQVALLRTLQDHEVRPVGAVKAVAVDLRVVCATHRELSSLVAEQRFRADLLARLSGFTMCLPPLRERIEELGTMVATILAEAAPQATLSRAAARRLIAHPWPLNTRELAQRLTTAALLGSGQIELEHLRLDTAAPVDSGSPASEVLSPEDAARRAQLIDLLSKHRGNVSAVAREMGKERVQIRRWLKRYRIV
jgi:DNA-binding NtrC family response regulator